MLQTTDDRQTDRQTTDGRPMTYSEHELEFTFVKKRASTPSVEMHVSAIIAFAHLYTYDVDLLISDRVNLLSNFHSHDEYLWQVSLKYVN